VESTTPKLVKTEAITIPDSLNCRNIATVTVSCEHSSSLYRILSLHDDAHQFYDVNSTWSISARLTKVMLEVHFLQPKELIVNLIFEPDMHCEIIDLIRFNSRFILLATPDSDDEARPVGAMIEVTPTTVFEEWEEIYVQIIRKRYEREEGIGRTDSDHLARKGIAFLRDQWNGSGTD